MNKHKKQESPKSKIRLSETFKSDVARSEGRDSGPKGTKGKPPSWVDKIDWFGERPD